MLPRFLRPRRWDHEMRGIEFRRDTHIEMKRMAELIRAPDGRTWYETALSEADMRGQAEREVEFLREALRRYGDRDRMACAESADLQQAIDRALGPDAAGTVRIFSIL